MRLSKLSVLLYVLLIFLSGAAVGALGFRLYTVGSVSATTRQPDEWRKRYTEEMKSRLHLSGDQLKNLNAILDETRTRFQEARERQKPEMEAIKHEQIGKIRQMLSDEQRTEYDKMRAEREAREKAQGRPPGPGF